MPARSGPVYEVTFFVDEAVVAGFDAWLDEWLPATDFGPAVIERRAFAIDPDSDGRCGRACQLLLAEEPPADAITDRLDAEFESAATAAFDDIHIASRLLREERPAAVPPGQSPDCLNCGSRLRGQYCGICGQRSRSRLISLWELVSDAFGDLFELDSRLWQTLVPLVVRPGRLTHDYLQGRRARFMPPFRMYLVMSLFFFVVAFFDPREELGLLFDAGPELSAPTAELPDPAPAGLSEAERVRRDVLDELQREGILAGPAGEADAETDDDASRITLGDDTNCDVDQSDVDDLPDWLARRLTVDRLNRICERIEVDNGRAFLGRLLDNVPAALIVLLPLMALVLKALYPLSRRYYVEHLLFFVHFHAFFFLMLTLQVLFARLAGMIGLPETAVALTLTISSLYIPVYLFVAMRKVYGQGRLVTFLKYGVLMTAYIAGFTVTMAGAILIAAMSA